nr:hypothetical protein [Cytophagales bacterium]
MQIVRLFIFLCVVFQASLVFAQDAAVQPISYSPELNNKGRLSLAQSFVSKLKNRLQQVSALTEQTTSERQNILPEGGTLLLQPTFKENIRSDGVVLATVKNGRIMLSLLDFTNVVELPIDISTGQGRAQGWYIREENEFFLDLENEVVRTSEGDFKPSEDIFVEGDDIFVPAEELGLWLGFDFEVKIAVQEIFMHSKGKLFPIEERYRRRKIKSNENRIAEPQLPRGDDKYKTADVPALDVFTNSVFSKRNGGEEATEIHTALVRTANDFANGTLLTQSDINNRDQITSFRTTYFKESPNPELLGSLKARRYELGDVTTARLPLGGIVRQELGARVTNADTLRNFSRPSTAISGRAFPGWDVELYRNNQLVGFQEVQSDGFYSFDDVDLFLSENSFRLVFYGPQGEIREETLSLPIDNTTFSRGESIYDVSISSEDENTYTRNEGFGNDRGAIRLAALYEKPILKNSTLLGSLRSDENSGERDTVATLGTSTTIMGNLVNTDVGIDDEGEAAAELTFRRDLGFQNQLLNTLEWQQEGFDSDGIGFLGNAENSPSLLQNRFSLNGPLPWGPGQRPRYNLNVNYTSDLDSLDRIASSVGFDTNFNRFSLSQQLQHITSSEQDDDTISAITSLNGAYRKNRFRLTSNYEIEPDNEVETIIAAYRRDITKKLQVELEVLRRPETSLTEYSASVDWQAGFVRITPRITYNSDEDIFATLSTRFGVLYDPSRNRPRMFDRTLTNSGAISAFVYLDKDGNGIFDGEDEPLKDIVVESAQNGGRSSTGEDGVAFFTSLVPLRLTDVYVDTETLQDPTWVTGFEGVSVVPREGNVLSIEFPVHVSGEVDGILYASTTTPEGIKVSPSPLRNVTLNLYNANGKIQEQTKTDSGGFYYFAQVPPGRYLLLIDEESAEEGRFIRPEPKRIEIGYDGTLLFGQDIYVEKGEGDIPSEFLSDLKSYEERHPHIDFSTEDYDIVLNLGDYNSRLMMSVIWYKIQSRFAGLLDGGDLFVPPTQSYADVQTGKHNLRVGFKDLSISEAYQKCKSFMVRDQYCKVEIFPGYLKEPKIAQVEPI